MAEKQQDGSYAQTPYAPPPGSTELLLVRHGASAPFVPGTPFDLVDGQGDPPLAPEGREQAKLVGTRLAQEQIDAIYVTNLQRTVQTAQPFLDHSGMTPIVEPELREVHLGDWEGGLFRQKMAEGHPAVLRMRENSEWGEVPGAETTAQFQGRCVTALDRIHANHPDQRVVVVCHGGVIGALCAHAIGAAPFAMGGANNGSLHHIVIDAVEGWKLRCFNDTAHLGGFSPGAQGMT